MALFVTHIVGYFYLKRSSLNYQSLKEDENLLQFLLSVFKHAISSYVWTELQSRHVRHLNVLKKFLNSERKP